MKEAKDIAYRAGYEACEEELGQCYSPIFKDGKKAGIREVVRWIEEGRPFLVPDDRRDWEAKLKEWGVD